MGGCSFQSGESLDGARVADWRENRLGGGRGVPCRQKGEARDQTERDEVGDWSLAKGESKKRKVAKRGQLSR